MAKCREDIEKAYPGVKTMQVVADFSKLRTLADYNKIAE
jgi:hypothetical protein